MRRNYPIQKQYKKIKYSYRITKYNPKYRDESGAYQKDDWICASDIERTFEGIKLTFEEYSKVENTYINAVLYFMDCLEIDFLKAIGLEKRLSLIRPIDTPIMIKIANEIYNGQNFSKELIPDLIRLLLRKVLWCKLENEKMFAHFGYDYYMFIGATKHCPEAIKKIEQSGLFVEDFISPWIIEDEI